MVLVACVTGTISCANMLPPAARAADRVPGLQVSPLTIQDRLAPGASSVHPIRLTAIGTEPITVTFEHADFGFDPATYAIRLIEDNAPSTVRFTTRDWLSVPRRVIVIPAGRSRTVPITIDVPRSATSGVHLGAALFRTVTPRARGADNQIVTSARTGPLIFVTVTGGSDPHPRITRFDVPRFTTRGPIPVHVTVGVRGSGFVFVSGDVTITGNGQKQHIPIPERVVISGTKRTILPSKGVDSTLGSRALPLGRYEVTTTLHANPTGDELQRTRVVWILPRWLIALVIIGFVLIVGSLTAALITVRRRRLDTLLEEYPDWEDSESEDTGDDTPALD